MRILLDTHILLWAATDSTRTKPGERLSATTRRLLEDEENELFFSPASIWEVAIKNALGRPEFQFDAHVLTRALMDNGYRELRISSAHTAAVADLPDHHRDPFDRLLVAQATVEGVMLLTSDRTIAKYRNSPVKLVK
jgi:PIN domain nuclease of toxin-antitoxin system